MNQIILDFGDNYVFRRETNLLKLNHIQESINLNTERILVFIPIIYTFNKGRILREISFDSYCSSPSYTTMEGNLRKSLNINLEKYVEDYFKKKENLELLFLSSKFQYLIDDLGTYTSLDTDILQRFVLNSEFKDTLIRIGNLQQLVYGSKIFFDIDNLAEDFKSKALEMREMFSSKKTINLSN